MLEAVLVTDDLEVRPYTTGFGGSPGIGVALMRPQARGRVALASADPAVPLVVAWLWDAHLGHCIQGVKAFRHRIVSRYPFADVQSCEKD
jgi:hypothetical protein